MGKEKQIKQKVDDTLGRLAELGDIDGHPFLHTHLQARISVYEKTKTSPSFLRFRMRDLRPAALLLLLGLNMIAGIFTVQAWAEDREKTQAAFAEEYILTREIGDVSSRL